ncbi:MAG: stage V sporulation T C-terminal domain-containing protein [Bacillota bacterium]
MKATGIVRKIDELGRVVIPMEIRRTLRIRDGEPLEIFTDEEGDIILRKFSSVSSFDNLAQDAAEALSESANRAIAITDRDAVVAVAGIDEDMVGRAVGPAVERCIASGELVASSHLTSGAEVVPLEDWSEEEYPEFYVLPVDADGVQGTVIVIRREGEAPLENGDLCAARSAAAILARMLRA